MAINVPAGQGLTQPTVEVMPCSQPSVLPTGLGKKHSIMQTVDSMNQDLRILDVPLQKKTILLLARRGGAYL